jgi:hypothetical protein
MKNDPRSLVRRLVLGGGLMLTVLTAAVNIPAARAAGPPALEPLKVMAMGTEATISVRASEPVAIGYQITTGSGVAPAAVAPLAQQNEAMQSQAQNQAHNQAQATPKPKPTSKPAPTATPSPAPSLLPVHNNVARDYETAFDFKVTGLKSNTTYTVSLTATTPDGRTATAQQTFTTLKLRVRVALREIDIEDDGDWIGDGEPMWTVKLDWNGGAAATCWPNTSSAGSGGICQAGSYGEGRFFPRNYLHDFLGWTFAEENFDAFPTKLAIQADAVEEDFIPVLPTVAQFIQDCLLHLPCGFQSRPLDEWAVPYDKEWSSTTLRVRGNDDVNSFKSVMVFTFETFHDNLSYPSARNQPSSTWFMP